MYFLQLVGTAMGTSAAVMWATLYYGYHEVHTLIPRHGNKMLYFRRFIDDIFAIWIGNLTTDWESFCADVNDFGILKWDVTENPPRKSVDFLDLTLTIDGNRIVSKTFQKKMNLYLYIPAASAHPEGCIKGTIFGLIRRYHAQNTYRKDYLCPNGKTALHPPSQAWMAKQLYPRSNLGRVHYLRRDQEEDEACTRRTTCQLKLQLNTQLQEKTPLLPLAIPSGRHLKEENTGVLRGTLQRPLQGTHGH